MTLHEALKTLPHEMIMLNHSDETKMSVAHWLNVLRDEPGAEMSERKINYGKTNHVAIYFTGAGVILSQVH